MPQEMWNKALAPLLGENLIDAFKTFAAQPGKIIPVASIAAAGVLLDRAASNNVTVNATNPAFFSVGASRPTQYVCVGKDGEDWDLVPFNEVESDERTELGSGKVISVAKDQHYWTNQSTLPARPYDRLVIAWATNHYTQASGSIDMQCVIGTDIALAHIPSGDNQSVAVFNMGIIRAGVTPVIESRTAGGGPSGGTYKLNAGDRRQNRLVVAAFPIRMKA